jgi:nitroreductase
MDIIEAIKQRKSVRGFKSNPVSKEIIEQILDIARWAPSAKNGQPWEFAVITGDVLENIKKTNVDFFRSRKELQPECGITDWSSNARRKRQIDLAKQLFQAMNISKEEKEKISKWSERGFRYFDAPAAIIVLIDRALTGSIPMLDIGSVMQTICLAAMQYGVGTCIEVQGVVYPEALRKFAGIPESKRIAASIAIGYPDWDFPANNIRSAREPLEDMITWYGFK